MAVPVKIADLNTTESSNSPSGSESVGVNLDNYLRAAFAILKQTQSKGSDIASGSTITIPDNGNYFVVTGTTTIGAINDSFNGRVSILKFSGALTLTDSAGLILFGADITTAAGDVLTVVNESAGVYRAISFFQAASGYTTLTGTETLTNKTIVAANNAITTAASGNLEATELNAALAELEAEITANIASIGTNTSDIATLDTEKAPLASPTLTGTPAAPTAATTTDTTQLATTAFVQQEIDAIVDVSSAWCVFDGTTAGTNTPTAGSNVATVERLSVGYYKITFSTEMANANYTRHEQHTTTGTEPLCVEDASEILTASYSVKIYQRGLGGGGVAGLFDSPNISLTFFGGTA